VHGCKLRKAVAVIAKHNLYLLHMKIFAETERLVMRELMPEDVQGMYELDSDPEVHRYLGNKPIHTTDEAKNVIALIRQQYADNGIARWAVIEKATGNFTGWGGLKLVKTEINGMTNYYDLGYRFAKKYWGQGYATETAKASLAYGFIQMGLPVIYAMANVDNAGSLNVLRKMA
jgi:RimJ/RimL family protein N-acetyltransferase